MAMLLPWSLNSAFSDTLGGRVTCKALAVMNKLKSVLRMRSDELCLSSAVTGSDGGDRRIPEM
jgi:hypothetical protein